MFGLPLETLLLLFGVPAVWIGYTIAFLVRSRTWDRDVEEPAED